MRKTKKTITAKHARALHADIRLRDQHIRALDTQLQRAQAETSDQLALAKRLELDRGAANVKLDSLMADLRATSDREIGARQLASELLDGINTVCQAAQSLSVPSHLTRTLLTLQRDGRAQLKTMNGARA